MPLLTRTGSLQRDAIFFHYPNYAFHGDNRLGSAVHTANWKLIENFDDGSYELYNLAEDISESHNLADSMPDRVAELARRLRQWRDDVDAAMPKRRSR
jgi:arylsulfatase A-like enzyme